MQRNGVKSLQIHRKYWFRIQKSYVLIIYYFFINVVMSSFVTCSPCFQNLLHIFSSIHLSFLPSLLLSLFYFLFKFFFWLLFADLSILFFRIFSFPFSSVFWDLLKLFLFFYFYFFYFIFIFYFFIFFKYSVLDVDHNIFVGKSDGKLQTVFQFLGNSLLTSVSCRLRWSELDAKKIWKILKTWRAGKKRKT